MQRSHFSRLKGSKTKRNEQVEIQNISDHIDSPQEGIGVNVGNFCLEAIQKCIP